MCFFFTKKRKWKIQSKREFDDWQYSTACVPCVAVTYVHSSALTFWVARTQTSNKTWNHTVFIPSIGKRKTSVFERKYVFFFTVIFSWNGFKEFFFSCRMKYCDMIMYLCFYVQWSLKFSHMNYNMNFNKIGFPMSCYFMRADKWKDRMTDG